MNLVKAKKLLESDDFSSKITSLLSEPVDSILKSLPKKWVAGISISSEKAITEMAFTYFVPLVGSITGSFVNVLFIEHFQNMAHGHFIVRSLERKYGQELIFKIYQDMKI